MTNLSNIVESLPIPDIDLLRSKITYVRGNGFVQASGAFDTVFYSYGLVVASETLDIDDIDPGSPTTGVSGYSWWGHRTICYRSVGHDQAAIVVADVRPVSVNARSSGRRIKNFGQSLWFVESVKTTGIAASAWNFEIGVQLP